MNILYSTCCRSNQKVQQQSYKYYIFNHSAELSVRLLHLLIFVCGGIYVNVLCVYVGGVVCVCVCMCMYKFA